MGIIMKIVPRTKTLRLYVPKRSKALRVISTGPISEVASTDRAVSVAIFFESSWSGRMNSKGDFSTSAGTVILTMLSIREDGVPREGYK